MLHAITGAVLCMFGTVLAISVVKVGLVVNNRVIVE